MEFVSRNEEETFALGRALGEKLSGGEIVLLSGDLGAGKTVFCKGIAAGLEIADTVVSPTFTLMNEYEGRLRLYHYDAYRLPSAREAREAGLCEYFGMSDGVCVIEWWQNIADALASYDTITVRIERTDESTRSIDIVDK